MSFSSFRLDPALLRGIAEMGFEQPTPIQRDGIPPALDGRDVLASAMTGSGKTAAFLLPIMQRLLGQRRGVTRALVLAPTRELAAQIVEHFEALARHTDLTAAAVFGGVKMPPQERALRRGVDLVVACPGRLLDHMQYPYATFRGLEVLVLDEADRMLDMGFLPDIQRILGRLPKVEQTMMFSATVPKPIATLARRLLSDPVTLNVERPAAPAAGVHQEVYPVPQKLKSHLLLALLRAGKITSALVFTRTKHRANRLAAFLQKNGVDSERIHGNRSQPQRTKALAGFKSGRYPVLVATDVAARGIDIEALSHVVNFDVPNVPEDYIHRVGRTARAGATGDALTFASPQERGELAAIERAVGRQLPKLTLDGFDYQHTPAERFEIPIGERIAEIRARKAADRARSRANAERKAQNAEAHSTKTRNAAESHHGDAAPGRRHPGRPASAQAAAGTDAGGRSQRRGRGRRRYR